MSRRKVQHGLWKTRVHGSTSQKGKHFQIHAQKAPMAPARFKGTPFASAHPHTETVDIRTKALDRLHMIIGRAKVEVAAGTPSSLNKALRYLEAQFKVGMHPGQAFGSQGISGLEQEPFYQNAKQTVMQARYLFNQALYTNDEARRTQLYEESSELLLNIDANIPFVPKPIASKEEKPSVSVKVSPKIYTQRPRRRGKPKAVSEAGPTIERIKEKIKGAPKSAAEAAQRMKLPEASWRIRSRKEEEKSATTRESASSVSGGMP